MDKRIWRNEKFYMRILYVPLYTTSNIEACSTFHFAKKFFLQLVSQFPDTYVYFPVFQRYIENPIITHPRIKLIDINSHRKIYKQRDDMSLFPAYLDQFRESDGKYYVDVVVCDKPMVSAAILDHLKSYTTNGSGGILLVNLHQFIVDSKINTFVHSHSFCSIVMGMAVADLNVFSLESDKNRMKAEERNYLSPAMIRKINDSSLLSLGGVDVEKVERFLSDERNEKFTVNWGYAYTNGYQVDKVFGEIDMLFRSGRDIEIIATSPGGKGSLIDFERFNYFTFMEKVPQEKFWEIISKCHAFVYMAWQGELSYSVLEQQILGLVGVFINKEYIEGMLYPEYPFIAKSHEEIAVYLRQIYENYESEWIQEVIEKQRQWVKDHFNIESRNKVVFEEIQSRYESLIDSYRNKSEPVQQLFQEIFDDGPIDHDTWISEVKEKSESKMNMLDNGGRFDQSKNRFRRLMQVAGYIDDGQEEMPVFRKIK